MFGFGPTETIAIFLVILLVFGAKKLPEIGTSLGKGIREFKSSVRDLEGELKVPPPAKKVARPPSGDGEPKRLSPRSKLFPEEKQGAGQD